MLTIPEYFKKYIDDKVDLEKTPKICCPFHDEDTPSFSYSSDRGVWRCFGACKVGGDVFDLHRKNMHFRTKDEARRDLCRREGVEVDDIEEYTESTYRVDGIDKRISKIALKLQLAFDRNDINGIVDLIQEASEYKV